MNNTALEITQLKPAKCNLYGIGFQKLLAVVSEEEEASSSYQEAAGREEVKGSDEPVQKKFKSFNTRTTSTAIDGSSFSSKSLSSSSSKSLSSSSSSSSGIVRMSNVLTNIVDPETSTLGLGVNDNDEYDEGNYFFDVDVYDTTAAHHHAGKYNTLGQINDYSSALYDKEISDDENDHHDNKQQKNIVNNVKFKQQQQQQQQQQQKTLNFKQQQKTSPTTLIQSMKLQIPKNFNPVHVFEKNINNNNNNNNLFTYNSKMISSSSASSSSSSSYTYSHLKIPRIGVHLRSFLWDAAEVDDNNITNDSTTDKFSIDNNNPIHPNIGISSATPIMRSNINNDNDNISTNRFNNNNNKNKKISAAVLPIPMADRFVVGGDYATADHYATADSNINSSSSSSNSNRVSSKSIRTTFEWHPEMLLCRRFSIANPFPDSHFVGIVANNTASTNTATSSTSTYTHYTANSTANNIKAIKTITKKNTTSNNNITNNSRSYNNNYSDIKINNALNIENANQTELTNDDDNNNNNNNNNDAHQDHHDVDDIFKNMMKDDTKIFTTDNNDDEIMMLENSLLIQQQQQQRPSIDVFRSIFGNTLHDDDKNNGNDDKIIMSSTTTATATAAAAANTTVNGNVDLDENLRGVNDDVKSHLIINSLDDDVFSGNSTNVRRGVNADDVLASERCGSNNVIIKKKSSDVRLGHKRNRQLSELDSMEVELQKLQQILTKNLKK